MVLINENTLRDGSYAVDFQLTAEDTKKVTCSLDAAGFPIVEVGHGLGLGAYKIPKIKSAENDQTYISAAHDGRTNCRLSAFFIPNIGSKEDIKIAHKNGLDILRVGININDYKQARAYADFAKGLGMEVAINGMKSYGVKSYEFCKIACEIDRWQVADSIYLVDSAGCMTPEEVREYVTRTTDNISTPLGFHGHNNLSLAVANSMEAVKCGVKYIDTCIRGMGRSAGNAQTEIIITLLHKLDMYKNINIYELYKIANTVITPLMKRAQGLTPNEIHIGLSKFHSGYLPDLTEAAEKYKIDPNILMKESSDINCLDPSSELFHSVAHSLSNE
jgi:4-hydroxy-2-oxovalerate aldolase